MIGVVVPAHDEEDAIGTTLVALLVAARHPGLNGETVRIVVVLDSCSDNTSAIVDRHGVESLAIQSRSVGSARQAGADRLIQAGARWLVFTDADTTVAADWLAHHIALAADADAVCGCIGIQDWSVHGVHAALLQHDFETTYSDREGHRHIHGANLGVGVQAYLRAGGFQPLRCQEDVALVAALEQTGARIAWSALPRVRTSTRTDSRASGGFGDAVHTALMRLVARPDGSAAVEIDSGGGGGGGENMGNARNGR